MKNFFICILLASCQIVSASVGDTISQGALKYVVTTEDTVSGLYQVRIAKYLSSHILVPDSILLGDNAYFVTEVPNYYDNKSCPLGHYTRIDYSQCKHLHNLVWQYTVNTDIDTFILPPSLETLKGPRLFCTVNPANIHGKQLSDPDHLLQGIHRIFSSGSGNPHLSIELNRCGALQELDFSSYTETIEAGYSFVNCHFLERCILPNGLKYGGDQSTSVLFGGDMRLTYFNWPDSLRVIGNDFATGAPISHFHVGPVLDSIAPHALYGWEYMDSISVDSANRIYCAIDGVLFSRDSSVLLHYPYSRNADTYVLPSHTRCAGGYFSFSIPLLPEEYRQVYRHNLKPSAGSLHTLVINDELERLGSLGDWMNSSIRKIVNLENCQMQICDGFRVSPSIDTLRMPATLKVIRTQAFYRMSALRCLDLSRADSLTLLADSAIAHAIRLDSLELLHCSLLKDVGAGLCIGDSALRYMSLPRNVSRIGYYAFANCVSLHKVVCPAFTPIKLTPGMKIFDGVNTADCELIVPNKSVPLYQQAPVWKDFQISSNGLYTIEGVPSDTLGGAVTGTGAYMQGETATLIAIAADGYDFLGWNDGVMNNPRQIVAKQDITLTALFQLTSGLSPVTNETNNPAHKYIKDGNIYIRYGGNSYSIHGEKQ